MQHLCSSSVLALVLALAAPASATTISFQNGSGGYAAADNESYSFDGTISHDVIRVDLPSADQPAGSYAWIFFGGLFDPGAIPTAATLVSATLQGFVSNPFGSASLTRLLDAIGSRPQGPSASVLDGAGSFFDDTQLVSAAHPACADIASCDPPVEIEWDVLAMVQAWLDGAPNHGFLLLPDTTDGGNLVTTDSDDPTRGPLLVIEYENSGVSVPEPALLALLALGSIPAARRRG